MLPRVDIHNRPVVTIEAPSAAAAITATKQEVASKLSQLVIGKQIQGEILSRRNDGTFFVKIAGATARMALPQESKVGDAIPLTLLTITPRPTFLLGGHGDQTSVATFSRQDLIKNFLPDNKFDPATANIVKDNVETSSAYILDLDAGSATTIANSKALNPEDTHLQIPRDEKPNSSTATTLSNAGKLINSILKDAELQGYKTSLVSKSVLLQNTEELGQASKLASHLQQIVSNSGLFYESHVANWADGRLAKSELMREPQAQMRNEASIDFASTINIDDSQIQLIRQQLDSLEQQRISIQAKLLPNLPFEWEIARDQNHKNTSQDEKDATPHWQSTVRLELPLLGVVAATINLRYGQLQLSLHSDSAATAHSLQAHAPELVEALNYAGSPLQSIRVKHDDQA